MLKTKEEILERGLVISGTEGVDLWTNSLAISDTFGKRHDHVLNDLKIAQEDISRILGACPSEYKIVERKYADSYGREKPFYIINKQAFDFVVLGYTGAQAKEYRLKFISEFYRRGQENLELQQQLIKEHQGRMNKLIADKIEAEQRAHLAESENEANKCYLESKVTILENSTEMGSHYLYLLHGKYKNKNVCKIGVTKRNPTIRRDECRRKYGIDNLEILELFQVEDDVTAYSMESYYISLSSNYFKPVYAWSDELLFCGREDAKALYNQVVRKFYNTWEVKKLKKAIE